MYLTIQHYLQEIKQKAVRTLTNSAGLKKGIPSKNSLLNRSKTYWKNVSIKNIFKKPQDP